MINYLLPIFCFGLVITGIVFLGIIEAARQARFIEKHERAQRLARDSHEFVLSNNGNHPRFTVNR